MYRQTDKTYVNACDHLCVATEGVALSSPVLVNKSIYYYTIAVNNVRGGGARYI